MNPREDHNYGEISAYVNMCIHIIYIYRCVCVCVFMAICCVFHPEPYPLWYHLQVRTFALMWSWKDDTDLHLFLMISACTPFTLGTSTRFSRSSSTWSSANCPLPMASWHHTAQTRAQFGNQQPSTTLAVELPSYRASMSRTSGSPWRPWRPWLVAVLLGAARWCFAARAIGVGLETTSLELDHGTALGERIGFGKVMRHVFT